MSATVASGAAGAGSDHDGEDERNKEGSASGSENDNKDVVLVLHEWHVVAIVVVIVAGFRGESCTADKVVGRSRASRDGSCRGWARSRGTGRDRREDALFLEGLFDYVFGELKGRVDINVAALDALRYTEGDIGWDLLRDVLDFLDTKLAESGRNSVGRELLEEPLGDLEGTGILVREGSYEDRGVAAEILLEMHRSHGEDGRLSDLDLIGDEACAVLLEGAGINSIACDHCQEFSRARVDMRPGT